MSKFCHVISNSKENKSQLETPLTFVQLENLIDALIKETSEAEDDLSRKAAFTADVDALICSNNDELTKLNKEVQKCITNMSIVEKEITEHEKTLLEIKQIVSKMEKRQHDTLCTPEYQSDYAAFLERIEALYSQIVQATANMESINEIAVENALPSTNQATQELIVSILNQHLDLLLHTERSLERLHENSVSIEDQLAILRQKQSQLFHD